MNELNLPPNPSRPGIYKVSAAWHGAMMVGGLAQPGLWPVWLGGVAANHLVLCTASMLPRSALLGPNIRQLPATAIDRKQVCLTIDDGPDPDITPLVLEQLANADARASFFCIGEKVSQHPDIVRQIIAAGHSVENHTQTHHHSFAFKGPTGLHAEIATAQDRIASVSGRAPVFFRAPAGMRNPLLQPVLADLDLRLASWTRRGFDTVERRADTVLNRLTHQLDAGDILLIHDGPPVRPGRGPAVVLEVLPKLLAVITRHKLNTVTLPEAFES